MTSKQPLRVPPPPRPPNRPFYIFRSVTWPLNGSEAGGDLVFIHTSLLFNVNQVVLMLINSN